MDRPKLKIITIIAMIAAFCDAGEPQSITHSSSVRSNVFEFNDSPNVVIIRGNRWFPLGGGNRAAGGVRIAPDNGWSSQGPGAIVKCVVGPGTCVVTQLYDGGAISTHTTYVVTRWDSDRIEAEYGSVDIASAILSEGYRQTLASTCLILNRGRKQVFTAQKQEGQTCRELDKKIDDGIVVPAEQLCAVSNGATTLFGVVVGQHQPYMTCPNPLTPTDKHGRAAPTPTYHRSNGVAYCEDWVLNNHGEWEDHIHKCSNQVTP